MTTAAAPVLDRASRRRALFVGIALRSMALGVSLIFAGSISEAIFRVLEYQESVHSVSEGPGGKWIGDPRWGFKPAPGRFRLGTPEFDMRGVINAEFMNERPWNPREAAATSRILVLGDSHTYAVGVNQEDTWERRLEDKLNAGGPRRRFRTYNAAVPGYSIHQYLLRLIDQGPAIKPDYVLVGFSYATDLYDLLPPDRGGSIYGEQFDRDYFDFDGDRLVEKHSSPGSDVKHATTSTATVSPVVRIRRLLENFATFRYVRRSDVALMIGSKVHIGSQSLWPNMDVVLERDTVPDHAYQWRLAFALLDRIKSECDRQHSRLIVVGIPYLPQVYDEIWDITFGTNPKYSRTAAVDRIGNWCQAHGVACVDTTTALAAKVRQTGRWVHYRRDAHPTAEGHEVIAQRIIDAGVISQ